MQDVNRDAVAAPQDDGAADHLQAMVLPDVPLPSTDGADVSVATSGGRMVIFCYPMTAEPDRALPDDWDEIPGARGCTPQACGFRDLAGDLADRGVDRIFGISTQSTSAQTEAKARLNLPYTNGRKVRPVLPRVGRGTSISEAPCSSKHRDQVADAANGSALPAVGIRCFSISLKGHPAANQIENFGRKVVRLFVWTP